MARMRTSAPARKVIAGSLAAALATLLVWLLETYVLTDPMPEAIKGAIVTLCTALAGYYTPPGPDDQIVPDALPHPPKGVRP